MAQFNLDNYETVEDRLVKFWEQHPDGRVLTSIHYYDDTRILVKAEIYFNREDERAVATGYAEELRGASPVNRTSHAENAETSAIGRGLANCGYAAKGSRPSREEMEKVQRGDTHTPIPANQNVNDVLGNLQQKFSGSKVVSTEPARSVAIKNPSEPASPKQIGMIRAIVASQGMNRDDQQFYVEAIIGRKVESLEEITKGEASLLITDLKK